ncbi:tRNA 2-thiouridine(34) synthase MnmA [Myxococcota bacterium]|nr:tRNA 2-thiouridine(34) synthase MnmA [Myxococcota bacterium]MCZ7619338.1 tRNA 2-thiouridine(34) synthase MnmA [Myxococcota bacterium]
MSERVLVAMSGGVDSSVAAALLVEQGFDVVGVSMRLSAEGSRCCSLDDVEDARRVATALGIRFYVADYTDAFRREVMEPFADAYLGGQTPIPCVACNGRFKFHRLLERARALGAERVATGHYARIERGGGDAGLELHCGADPRKDQSYFLFDLGPDQLSRACFPVGALTKQEVRERARRLGLGTAEKPESQEICFVPDGDYARVVETLRPGAAPGAGEILDEEGNVLGRHRGVHHFTVGQRRGLDLALGRPMYVKRIDAARNRVVVAERSALGAAGARLVGVHWVAGRAPASPVRARVRVRYRHPGAEARVEALDRQGAQVAFDDPVEAVTPGQAAVFYDGSQVLGGGWIAEAVS